MQSAKLADYWNSPTPQEFRRVYHVSPTVLTQAIDHYGIDPAFANGALKVSWYGDKNVLLWAIAHISALKSISVDQLTIHQVSVWKGLLACTKSPGVFTCRFVINVHRSYEATDAFKWFHPDGSFNNG